MAEIKVDVRDGYVIDLGPSLVERLAKVIEKGIADLDLRGPFDYSSIARAVIAEMLRSKYPPTVGVDFGPKPAAVAIAQIDVDLCFEALPDFLLK